MRGNISFQLILYCCLKGIFFIYKTLLRYREFETEYSLQSYQTGELTVVLVGPSVVSTTLTSWASVGADSAIASTFTPMDSSIISF